MLVYYFKANHPHIIKNYITSLTVVEKSTKNVRIFMYLCSNKHDFGISAEWVLLATSYFRSARDGIGGAVKMTRSQAKSPKVFE